MTNDEKDLAGGERSVFDRGSYAQKLKRRYSDHPRPPALDDDPRPPASIKSTAKNLRFKTKHGRIRL